MTRPVLITAALFASAAALGQEPGDIDTSRLDWIEVTATRFAEPVQEVPNDVSVITGDDLRARGANDLRTALALLGGVTVASGGDGGPAGSVPALLGLREVDDFLLLVDGIPSGGVFIPHFDTLDLHDIQRIEVVRGPAPVYYGTTAFAGTINVIRYPAGEAAGSASASGGSYGSYGVDGSTVLSNGKVNQSIAVDFTNVGTSDPRAGFDREHGLYRLASDLDGGELRFDLDLLAQHQSPSSPTPVTDSGQLTKQLSPDFNQNPSDAEINTSGTRGVLGYDRQTVLGSWGTTLSLTHLNVKTVQGFLQDGYATTVVDNAAGFSQRRTVNDLYFDSGITKNLSPDVAVTYGFNEVYGRVEQDSATFPYTVPLDGSTPPSSSQQPIESRTTFKDSRNFFGAFTQARWKATKDLTVLAGLRWNHTDETQDASDGTSTSHQSERTSRWSGAFGVNWRVWQDIQGDLDDVTVYANTGNTFQPPQVDLGPDAGFAPLLQPETERSFEVGVKADGLDGRLDLDVTAFYVDFNHQAVATSVNGMPTLVNGGENRFKGVEFEGSWLALDALRFAGSFSIDDARYVNFNTLIGDTMVQLAGNYLILSPRYLGALSATYAPTRGWRASATTNYVGARYLDPQNTARVGGFITADASLGYVFTNCTLLLSGHNLTDRRDPVLASELGEGQFYRLPSRWMQLAVTVPLR